MPLHATWALEPRGAMPRRVALPALAVLTAFGAFTGEIIVESYKTIAGPDANRAPSFAAIGERCLGAGGKWLVVVSSVHTVAYLRVESVTLLEAAYYIGITNGSFMAGFLLIVCLNATGATAVEVPWISSSPRSKRRAASVVHV